MGLLSRLLAPSGTNALPLVPVGANPGGYRWLQSGLNVLVLVPVGASPGKKLFIPMDGSNRDKNYTFVPD